MGYGIWGQCLPCLRKHWRRHCTWKIKCTTMLRRRISMKHRNYHEVQNVFIYTTTGLAILWRSCETAILGQVVISGKQIRTRRILFIFGDERRACVVWYYENDRSFRWSYPARNIRCLAGYGLPASRGGGRQGEWQPQFSDLHTRANVIHGRNPVCRIDGELIRRPGREWRKTADRYVRRWGDG